MGLANLQTAANANEGRWLHIEHLDTRVPLYADGPDGKDDETKPVRILLLGRDSDEYIKAERANRNRAVENIKKQVAFSAAEDDRLGAQTLASCCKGWENIPQGWVDGTNDETPATFSREAALRLFQNPGVTWVKEQVDDFISKRANFLKA